MLARTHGQAASPTKLGKEIMVFIERLENQNFAFFDGQSRFSDFHDFRSPNQIHMYIADPQSSM